MNKIKSIFKDPRFIVMNVLVSIMIFNGIAVYFVESKYPDSPIKSLPDAFWWLLVTISTVGYGDIVPKSEMGKMLGSVTIIVGVAFFTMITGSIASFLVEMRMNERKGLGKVRERNHVVILGKNENLLRLLKHLLAFGIKSIALVSEMEEDEFESIREHYPEADIRFVKGDYTKDQVLRRASIKTASSVVVLSDTTRSIEEADEKTLIAVLSVRSISPSVRVIAEVLREEKVKHILRAGADEVVGFGQFNPVFMGSFVVSPALHAFISQLLKEAMFGIEWLPQNFVGKTFKELFEAMRKEKGVMVVGIITEKKKVAIEDILTGDKAIDEFLKKKLEEADMDLFGEEKEYSIALNPKDDYVIDEKDTMIVYMG